MGDGLSATGPGSPAGAANGEPRTVVPDHEPVTRPLLGDAADKARAGAPAHEPVTRHRLGGAGEEAGALAPGREPVTRQRLGDAAGLAPQPPAGVESQPAGVPVEPVAAAPGDLVRYGPGVPAGPAAASAGLTAEHIWRGGGTPGPRRRRSRLGQVLGWALTVVLLAASGVLFYLRFHHVPLQDTGVAIVGPGSPACRVTVTGQISTNGGPGTLTYQWLFPTGPPSTLRQSVSAGQSTVDVQATVVGSGHGMAPQRVSLRVLEPVPRTASKYLLIRCR
jgi:hypothetical protein